MEATIYTILDSPIHTRTATGGQGTANDPILVDINTPPQPDSPVKVVLGERYRYDNLCYASTFDLILYNVMFHYWLPNFTPITGELCALSVQYPTVNPAIPILTQRTSSQMTKRREMREKRCSGIRARVLPKVSTSIKYYSWGKSRKVSWSAHA